MDSCTFFSSWSLPPSHSLFCAPSRALAQASLDAVDFRQQRSNFVNRSVARFYLLVSQVVLGTVRLSFAFAFAFGLLTNCLYTLDHSDRFCRNSSTSRCFCGSGLCFSCQGQKGLSCPFLFLSFCSASSPESESARLSLAQLSVLALIRFAAVFTARQCAAEVLPALAQSSPSLSLSGVAHTSSAPLPL